MSSALLSFAVLLLVVLSIPLVLWLVRRLSQWPGNRTGGMLSMPATLPVGPREQIAIVKAGERVLLVGITSQQIQLLAELDGLPEVPPASGSTAQGTGFGSLLAGLQKGRQG